MHTDSRSAEEADLESFDSYEQTYHACLSKARLAQNHWTAQTVLKACK